MLLQTHRNVAKMNIYFFFFTQKLNFIISTLRNIDLKLLYVALDFGNIFSALTNFAATSKRLLQI